MIGFIGGGRMAEALIKGIVKQGNKNILVSDIQEQRRLHIETSYGVKTTESNQNVTNLCEIIILAVKPQDMITVLDEIADSVTKEKTIVSIAAGIKLDVFQKKLKAEKIVRVMPNIASIEQEGVTLISFSKLFPLHQKSTIQKLFMSVGKILIIDEEMINVFSTISGSGPAFLALFMETLIEAGIKMGLEKDLVAKATLQTFIGTAKLLEAGMPPNQLREMVTSPGGTTAEGIRVFNEKKIKKITASALSASLKKAEELGE
jgi:pyrroline-5-carboxylate reductase